MRWALGYKKTTCIQSCSLMIFSCYINVKTAVETEITFSFEFRFHLRIFVVIFCKAFNKKYINFKKSIDGKTTYY